MLMPLSWHQGVPYLSFEREAQFLAPVKRQGFATRSASMCSFRWLENLLIMTKCKFWKIATSLKEKPQCCKTDFLLLISFPLV